MKKTIAFIILVSVAVASCYRYPKGTYKIRNGGCMSQYFSGYK